MHQKKELGKYTLPQFKQLIDAVSGLNRLRMELESEIRANPVRTQEIFTPGFNWSTFYEAPFLSHLLSLIHMMEVGQMFIEASKGPDPQQVILDQLHVDDDVPEWSGGPGGKFELKELAGGLVALMRSIESMAIFSKFLNELVADVHNGNDRSLFKAVQIDKSIVACPTIADRISRAELEKDDQFFYKLSKAIVGKAERPKEERSDLRFALYLLSDGEGLDALTMERAYQLFCLDLQLYPSDGEDPARSLWQFIARWKKARST